MKRTIIATLVGGIILFIWQFLSWTVLNSHEKMQAYTPKQGEILNYLNENLEEGFYYLPTYPAGTSTEEGQKLMEANIGKPWAQVYFHKALKMNMGSNMARGILVDILAVWLLVWVLSKMTNPNAQTILLSSVFIGLVGYLSGVYTNSIWFETKTMADLIDSLVSWGLVGGWLSWWLRR